MALPCSKGRELGFIEGLHGFRRKQADLRNLRCFGYLGLGFKVRACNVAVTILNPVTIEIFPGAEFPGGSGVLIA